MSDLIDRLWERFGSLTFADLPDDVRTVAEQSILDWFGCALAQAPTTTSTDLA